MLRSLSKRAAADIRGELLRRRDKASYCRSSEQCGEPTKVSWDQSRPLKRGCPVFSSKYVLLNFTDNDLLTQKTDRANLLNTWVNIVMPGSVGITICGIISSHLMRKYFSVPYSI